jgi:GNAT superfamily N-acetyltransferase
VNFREATVDDIAGMHTVRMAVHENVLSSPDLIKHSDYEKMLTGRGKGWVCIKDEKVVGFAIVDVEDRNVWALFVLPELEKQGIGRQLHDEMLSCYFAGNEDALWLSTDPQTRAAAFYCAAGWIPEGAFHYDEVKFTITAQQWKEASAHSN